MGVLIEIESSAIRFVFKSGEYGSDEVNYGQAQAETIAYLEKRIGEMIEDEDGSPTAATRHDIERARDLIDWLCAGHMTAADRIGRADEGLCFGRYTVWVRAYNN